MTPKEKAIELYDKYLEFTSWEYPCKQCALIAVDEIIAACEYNMVETWNTEWWNKVKEEINAL